MPVRVVDDNGAEIDVGGQRQRLLLLALVARQGRTVPLSELIDRTWGDGEQPANADRSIRTYISRLRVVLGTSGDALVTESAGYRLTPGDRLVVDGDELAALVTDAQAARRRGEPSTAADLAGRASALIRGRPYGEFNDVDWLRPEVERLGELSALAREERAEALLEAGAPETAIAELATLSTEYPLRERPLRLRMLALFRCGRQAEALRVFQEYRHQLATDLGLEPGKEARDLEARIASGDAALEYAARPVPLRGYRLLERLGEGAFSIVYRGTQPSVERDVAVKVIRAELANRPEFVRRFEAEAQLVARLEHPHIVPLYDFWREPGSAYLVMRYLRAGSLEGALLNGPWDLARAVTMIEQIGGALSTAHRGGVVHRDVKSANVLLDDNGHAYLTDFGIALEVAELDDPAAALSAGSPAYASPEQLRREPVGPAADVHGLGITLYETLTAQLPFPNERNQASLLRRQLNDPVPSLRLIRPELPIAVDDVVRRATAKSPSDRYTSVVEMVEALRAAAGLGAAGRQGSGIGRRGSATVLGVGDRNPYKGLRAFDEGDASEFAGRERLVDQLVNSLASHRLVAVVGPSGSGKSSVVRAGLIPALRAGRVSSSADWFLTTMIPGPRPFEELEAALLRVSTGSATALLDQLADGERGLARTLRRVLPEHGEALLVIDQFEELFTLAEPSVARAFIDALVAAVSEERSRLRVVLTLRADFFDRPLRHDGLGRLVRDATVAVLPLQADELERAIVVPAESVGCEPEPGLVSEIVADFADQPGALPLLQYALTELWERRVSGLLTRDAYRELGGVAGALARRAEELYTGCSAAEQDALRRVIGRLVSLGEGTGDTRRRALRSELGTDPAVASVVDRFGAARLLSFDRDPATREATVEVAHEALLREWPRLRVWLDDDRDGLRTLRHLHEAAAAWDAGGLDGGDLYRSARLESALTWLASGTAELTASEQSFVDASVVDRDRVAADERERFDAQVRANRRLRALLSGVGLALVVALVASGLAFQQRRRADRSAATANRERSAATSTAFKAETGRLAALAPTFVENDLSLAMLLAAESNRRESTPESLGALQQTLVAADTHLAFRFSDEPMRGVFWEEDKNRIVGFGESSIVAWDLTTGKRTLLHKMVLPLKDRGIANLDQFAYANGTAAFVDSDRVAQLLRLDGAGAATPLAENAADVALSPDGRQLAIALFSGEVRQYELPAETVQWTLAGDGLSTMGEQHPKADYSLRPESLNASLGGTLRYSDDGSRLFFGRGVMVTLIDAKTGSRLASRDTSENDRATGLPNAVIVHPRFRKDGLSAVVAAGRTVAAFDVPSLTPRSRFLSGMGGEAQLLVPPALLDDGLLALAHSDSAFAIVRESDGQILEGPNDARIGRIASMTASSDGDVLAIAGDRGLALLALDGGGLLRSAVARQPQQLNLGGGRDASWIVANSPLAIKDRPPAGVWRCLPAPCVKDRTLTIGPADVIETDLSNPDVIHVYHVGDPSSIDLFDSRSLARLGPTIKKETVSQWASAMDPRSRWYATNNYDFSTANVHTIQVNDVATGRRLALIPYDRSNGPLLLTTPPSGDVLLATQASGASFLVDTATWQVRPSPLAPGEASAAGYSQDGRWLVTLNVGGVLTLRDPHSYKAIRRMAAGAGGLDSFGYQFFAFSDDGRYLVTTNDNRARLWDVATGEMIGRPLTALARSTVPSLPGKTLHVLTATERWIQIWNFDPATWRDTACRAAGRNLTREEWTQYGPRDTPYRATCPQWGVVEPPS